MAAVTLVYSCDRDIIDDTKQENGKDVIKDIELVEASKISYSLNEGSDGFTFTWPGSENVKDYSCYIEQINVKADTKTPVTARANADGTWSAMVKGLATGRYRFGIKPIPKDGHELITDSYTIIDITVPARADVENVTELACTLNETEDGFTVTWKGVENASGYKCQYIMTESDGKVAEELTPASEQDGFWSASTNEALAPGEYEVTVVPVPADGHALKESEPASIIVTIPVKVTGDVENVNDLSYTTNTELTQFTVTWTGVAYAAGYTCKFMYADDWTTRTDLNVTDNRDGTFSAKSPAAIGGSTYRIEVTSIPEEGHELVSDTPAVLNVTLPGLKTSSLGYSKMKESERDTRHYLDYYGFCVYYMNIVNSKTFSDEKAHPTSTNWYIYSATAVKNINHMEIWYTSEFARYEDQIRLYSCASEGEKGTLLTPEKRMLSGEYKVVYKFPEGHEYFYLEGSGDSADKVELVHSGLTIYYIP